MSTERSTSAEEVEDSLQPVVIQSRWFLSAYERAVHNRPIVLTEQALVDMVSRTVAIALDDGEISEEQLRYEVGLLVGTLIHSLKGSRNDIYPQLHILDGGVSQVCNSG